MGQEDKIKREIDRVGLALAKLLSILLKKDYPDSHDAISDFAQQFNTELNIDLEAFLAMDKSAGLDLLVNDKKFSIENLRNLANLLYEFAHKTTDEQRQKKLLEKALNIYEYISTHSNGTLYLDVEYRLKELQ